MTSQPSASWRSNQNGGGGFKLGQVRQFRKDHMALISFVFAGDGETFRGVSARSGLIKLERRAAFNSRSAAGKATFSQTLGKPC